MSPFYLSAEQDHALLRRQIAAKYRIPQTYLGGDLLFPPLTLWTGSTLKRCALIETAPWRGYAR